jgi:tubulin---tyrosine ligase
MGLEVTKQKAGIDTESITRHTHKRFKWAPRLADVYKSVEEAGPGNDGWAVKEGFTRYGLLQIKYVFEAVLMLLHSVTPLKANFMHSGPATEGELKM